MLSFKSLNCYIAIISSIKNVCCANSNSFLFSCSRSFFHHSKVSLFSSRACSLSVIYVQYCYIYARYTSSSMYVTINTPECFIFKFYIVISVGFSIWDVHIEMTVFHSKEYGFVHGAWKKKSGTHVYVLMAW